VGLGGIDAASDGVVVAKTSHGGEAGAAKARSYAKGPADDPLGARLGTEVALGSVRKAETAFIGVGAPPQPGSWRAAKTNMDLEILLPDLLTGVSTALSDTA
jgi:hypothetical protein